MRSLPEQAKRHTPAEFGETSRHAPVFFPAGRRRSPAPSQRPAVFCACRAELLSGTQERRGAFGLCASHPCCANAFPARIAAEAPRPCFFWRNACGAEFSPSSGRRGIFPHNTHGLFRENIRSGVCPRLSLRGGGRASACAQPGARNLCPVPAPSGCFIMEVSAGCPGKGHRCVSGKGFVGLLPRNPACMADALPRRETARGPGRAFWPVCTGVFRACVLGRKIWDRGGRAMDVLRNLPQGLAEKARHKAFVPQRGPLPSCCRLARMSCRMLWRVVGACGRAFLTHKRGVREIAGDAFCRFRRFPCRSSLRFSSAPRPSGQERRRSAASWAGLSFPVRLSQDHP